MFNRYYIFSIRKYIRISKYNKIAYKTRLNTFF